MGDQKVSSQEILESTRMARGFWNHFFLKFISVISKIIFQNLFSGISKICKRENKNLFNGARKGEYEKFKPKKKFLKPKIIFGDIKKLFQKLFFKF